MFKSFPDEEVTRINSNIFIHKVTCGDVFRVYFNVGMQYFQIGIDNSNIGDAKFTAEMFVKALERFKQL